MSLSKTAKRIMKMMNKELKEQSLRATWTFSDNVEELLNSLPQDQMIQVVSHYAIMLRIMSEQVQKKPMPYELHELLVMVGLKDQVIESVDA